MDAEVDVDIDCTWTDSVSVEDRIYGERERERERETRRHACRSMSGARHGQTGQNCGLSSIMVLEVEDKGWMDSRLTFLPSGWKRLSVPRIGVGARVGGWSWRCEVERRGGKVGRWEGGMRCGRRQGQVHGYPVWNGSTCTYLPLPSHGAVHVRDCSFLPACTVLRDAHPHKQYPDT